MSADHVNYNPRWDSSVGGVRWERVRDTTRYDRCVALREAIDHLREGSGDQAKADPVAIFELHEAKFSEAALKKIESFASDEQGDFIVGKADLVALGY